MSDKSKPSTKARGSVFLKSAMQAIADAGGSLPLRDVKKALAARVTFDDHDLARYEKTGYVRWESILHFYSIDAVKAGFIRKANGRWYLTEEGRAALQLPADQLLAEATRRYRAWKAEQPPEPVGPVTGPPDLPASGAEEVIVASERSFVLEKAEAEARGEIEDFVTALGPYEFQDRVAALLRGMGYTTPYVAAPGPDGGTDIIAYPDPLGAKTPHVRVQVKHRPSQKATREEIAALRGIVRQDREIGLFVSTAGFTSQAVIEARNGAVHIQLMDLEGFLDGWMAVYQSLDEEDRALLRLRPVYFLSPA
jgi:restriction system protein